MRDEQFKKAATRYKYKYWKHKREVICDDMKCQAPKKTVCDSKNCPSTQSSDMQPVKPAMKSEDLWLREPATKSHSGLYSDKNCHSTRYFRKISRRPIRLMCGDDKSCQTTLGSNMWPVQTKFNHMQLTELARCFNTNCYKMQSDPEKR